MIRRIAGFLALAVALILSMAPLVVQDNDIATRAHHIDHAVLMALGAFAGLILARRSEGESPGWIWIAVIAPIIAMFGMSPSLYAIADRAPLLHATDHLVFVILAFLTAYAGQRYVYYVGWATAALLESMAVVAALGYGVAPPAIPIAAAPVQARPAAANTSIVHGRAIFAQDCAACHGARGEGGVGPRLIDEASRKNFDQAVAWIEKPLPPMPTLFPQPLSVRDVDDVAAYVETLK